MEELNEEAIVKMAEEYADSRIKFFKPWQDSYYLACKNAFVNAYVSGWFAKCRQLDPDFIEPKPIENES